MSADPAITACADLVQRGDPDRFLATMAAPPAVRPALFTLYAANLEIARAPWVTSEPMIAQMRLQFWRNAIANPANPPAHDIAAPLALLIEEKALPQEPFECLIAAREADLARAPFTDEAALWAYLEDTAGSLMALALRIFGTSADEVARDWGAAQGLANYLLAVPALQGAGRLPLPDNRPETIAALAQTGRARLAQARASTKSQPRAARPALLAAWRAGPLLRQSARYPDRVAQGTLGQSEFTRRLTLLRASLTGP